MAWTISFVFRTDSRWFRNKRKIVIAIRSVWHEAEIALILCTEKKSVNSTAAFAKMDFHFRSNLMECDRGDSFPFDFLNHIQLNLVQKCYHDHIEWNMIVVTVFLSIFLTKRNQIWFKTVKTITFKNCHHNHIPLNFKVNRNSFFFL